MDEDALEGIDLMLVELLSVVKRPFSLKFPRTINLKEKLPVRMIIGRIEELLRK